MDDHDFVATQVAHRLGAIGAARLGLNETARDYALAVSSGGALAWNAAAHAPFAAHGWLPNPDQPDVPHSTARGVRPEKSQGALQSLLRAGADFDLMIDMQDRRVRSLETADGQVFPTFVFNRVEGAAGRILWPMPTELHAIGANAFLGPFPDPDALPFAERTARVVWRGGMTGRGGGRGDVRLEGFRFQKLFAEVESGRRALSWAHKKLHDFPRFAFVRHLSTDPRADVGLIEQEWLHPLSKPILAPVTRSAMPQRLQARAKYIAVLRGADLASSFFWTMNSGSLGLVMETPWESFASVHFKPWVHYVPFKVDMSDFDERFAWCEDNPADCAEMVREAGQMCQYLARKDLRHAADGMVIKTLRAALGLPHVAAQMVV